MPFDVNVIETIQRTADVKSIRFGRPPGFDYLAGQYIFITLGSGPSQMTKHFTISSSPTEGFLEITKRLTGHEFANALAGQKIGDRISIDGPYGGFTFQGDNDKIGMLSGGIGITPLRSMIRYSTDKRLQTSIILLYSNSHEDDIAFGSELDEIQGQNPHFKVVNTITKPGLGWSGSTGRIDAKMVMKFIPDFAERIFYTSGPQRMVDAMVSLLRGLKIPEAQIKQESFPGYD
jgi:ferredoxin-NADP reductase